MNSKKYKNPLEYIRHLEDKLDDLKYLNQILVACLIMMLVFYVLLFVTFY